jgi:hypothetical protein
MNGTLVFRAVPHGKIFQSAVGTIGFLGVISSEEEMFRNSVKAAEKRKLGEHNHIGPDVILNYRSHSKRFRPHETKHRVRQAQVLYQIAKSRLRNRRVAVAAPVDVLTQLSALTVDKNCVRVTQHNGRIGIEDRATFGEMFRGADVIACGPLEVLGPGKLKGSIEIPDSASISITSVIPDASVPSSVGSTDFLRAVRRSVVGNHQLKIRVRLR